MPEGRLILTFVLGESSYAFQWSDLSAINVIFTFQPFYKQSYAFARPALCTGSHLSDGGLRLSLSSRR